MFTLADFLGGQSRWRLSQDFLKARGGNSQRINPELTNSANCELPAIPNDSVDEFAAGGKLLIATS